MFSFHSTINRVCIRKIQIVHTFWNRVDVIPMFYFSRNGTFGICKINSNGNKYSKTYSVYDTNLTAHKIVASIWVVQSRKVTFGNSC